MTAPRTLQRIGDDEQLTFNELLRAVGNVEFETTYPPDGEFFIRSHGGREYWYHRGRSSDLLLPNHGSCTRYVGPCGDPEIEVRIGRRIRDIADPSHLRENGESLRQSGLTGATNMEGRVLRALATAGVFRLRAVLVGSVAYQAYSGLLGVKLPYASVRTDDVDIAMDFGISNSIDDIPQALRQVDPSFATGLTFRGSCADRILLGLPLMEDRPSTWSVGKTRHIDELGGETQNKGNGYDPHSDFQNHRIRVGRNRMTVRYPAQCLRDGWNHEQEDGDAEQQGLNILS